jgi:nitric oxide reductase NorD protein
MLDWEEKIFLGLKAVYERVRVRPAQQRLRARQATLAERRTALLLLGQMVAGRPLGILETDERRLCGGGRLFLPRACALAPTPDLNAAFYELKTVLAALALRDRWDGTESMRSTLLPRWQDELPGLSDCLQRLEAAATGSLWDHLGSPASPEPAVDRPGSIPDRAQPAGESSDHPVTEIEGRGRAEVEVQLAPDDDGEGADLPMHTFEKVEILEEFSGLSRKSDDDDELEEHAEALEALDMRHLWRSAERPRSIYRSDLILDGLALEVQGDAAGPGIAYPEWDYQRGRYRPDWCRVQPGTAGPELPSWSAAMRRQHRQLIDRLRREFASIVSEWERRRRQPAGPEFDLDAVVAMEVDRRTGRTPEESIYLDRRRALHDVAALILVDHSYSTDGWIHERRVLDTITGTLFAAGEVLDDFVTRWAVAAFSSNTRRACSFSMVKDFAEPWSHASGRLGSLQPCGYTRIGPALRHAQELISRQPAQRRLVIVITDGRPCDYDRYEGEYGIRDVKKAIETGAQHGITTHAFAIEKQACESFPRMFTPRRFDIIPRPEALTRKLCSLFARTLAG